MQKNILYQGFLLFFLILALQPCFAQKRVAVIKIDHNTGNPAGPNAIESAIHTMLLGNGYSVVADTVAADYKIRFSATTVSTNTTNDLTFIYINAEVAIIDLPSRKETYHLQLSGIKGGGVNMAVAYQKAYRFAGRKIADSIGQLLKGSPQLAAQTGPAQAAAVTPPSDVDLNIPETPIRNDKTYALVIGNEDYKSYQQDLNDEVNVDFAIHDASIFKTYLNKTLGIPEENIKLLLNAKSIEMHREVRKLVSYIKALNGTAGIIVFYAGHGLPDEVTHEPFLIPVDVSGSDLQFAVKLSDLCAELTSFPAGRVTLFIDACFTGGARNQALIAARGVKIKPKTDALSGNLVIFSASSGDQSSLAYKPKSHGMFTYYLLKKIQETKGNVSYKSLGDFLSREVAIQSVRINNKDQNPQVRASDDLRDQWESWMLRP
ncbi:MAG: caspase family protein [Bacteroidota bacterium]